MSTFRCPRCTADPQPPHFGSPRNCAFNADGSFTPDNWNCATLDALMENAKEHWGDDESMQVVLWAYEFDASAWYDLPPGAPPVMERGTDGWLIFTRYKSRGCTDAAGHFNQHDGFRPLTLAMAEAFLARVPPPREQ